MRERGDDGRGRREWEKKRREGVMMKERGRNSEKGGRKMRSEADGEGERREIDR